MKVLLTGASSFSGLWFAEELVRAGHQVVAPLRSPSLEAYTGVRKERVLRLGQIAEVHLDATFGGPRFMELFAKGADLLCHHAASVENYKSMDFDVNRAFVENTNNIRAITETGRSAGIRGILVTGTIFEADEGAGENPLRAFSPYGLSKTLSFQAMQYWAQNAGVALAKFLIPNPFGPFEEPRFCAYLLGRWALGQPASVKTPSYLRDNIHVRLLAKAYAAAATRLFDERAPFKLGPSGYAETQGAFAQRFARELSPRLGIPCELQLEEQTDFSEPRMRLNKDVPDHAALGFSEQEAWDDLGAYYRRVYLGRA